MQVCKFFTLSFLVVSAVFVFFSLAFSFSFHRRQQIHELSLNSFVEKLLLSVPCLESLRFCIHFSFKVQLSVFKLLHGVLKFAITLAFRRFSMLLRLAGRIFSQFVLFNINSFAIIDYYNTIFNLNLR